MKRNIGARLLGLAGIMVVCLAGTSPGNAQIFEPQISLRDLAPSLSTPELIAHFMWQHFSFESDPVHFGRKDYWQSPEELFIARRGDCEDFALFAQELLKRNGIPSFLMSIYGKGVGHTVCVFKENGKYHVIDGVRVARYGSKTLQELSSEINPFWQKAAIVVRSSNPAQGKILKQFEKK